ncbi:MAG: alpha/beta hydrolase, partial [Hydrogenophaga sp.]|nr:alpha/beta hydrolase [Hydrogenophaga sp.]
MTLPKFTTLGSGPTVLMLHGIGGGHRAFAPQVETLASLGFRAVAWDMPGYGRSAPIEPYGFKGLAQRCVDLIDALQCDNVTLLGHSMGGMVAQEVIARRPDKVNKLILCGTSAAFGKRTDGRSAEAWAQQFIAQRTAPLDAGQTMADMAARLVPQMVGPGSLPEGLKLAEHCMASVPAATYRRALECLVT